MKPPVIHCPTHTSRKAVVEAIYGAGYRVAHIRTAQEMMLGYPTDKTCEQSPYIGMSPDGAPDLRFYTYWKPRIGSILVNSPRHLIAYCRAMGKDGPRVCA
jgi:hypothetical protein